jgi:hypothetical protein
MAGLQDEVALVVENTGIGVGMFSDVPEIMPMIGKRSGKKVGDALDGRVAAKKPTEPTEKIGETSEWHAGFSILAVDFQPER